MNTRELKELYTEFFEIVSALVIESDRRKINSMTNRALRIINDLKDYLNYNMEYCGYRMTALDYIIFLDTQGYNSSNPTRVNNPSLVQIEQAIEDAIRESSEITILVEEEGSENTVMLRTTTSYASFMLSLVVLLVLTLIVYGYAIYNNTHDDPFRTTNLEDVTITPFSVLNKAVEKN